VVDDLQWCDAPSARALAFIARRLEGEPLAVVLATRPLDPVRAPEPAALVADPAAERLRLPPLTQEAVAAWSPCGSRTSPTIGSSARAWT
jgi:predicted ATPase